MTDSTEQKTNKPLTIKLIIVAILMFAFAFALVPLYDVFCAITGFNGKTGDQVFVQAGDAELVADVSREVKVQFLSVNNETAAIKFEPKQYSVTVKPGEMTEVFYLATNLTDKEMVTQSVPSVSPLEAAEHLKKIECFCFQNQTIAAGETKEMPLRFYLEKELPSDISKLTLNYTIFDITDPSDAPEVAHEHNHDHEGSHEHGS